MSSRSTEKAVASELSTKDKENLVGAGRILRTDRQSAKTRAKSVNVSKKKSETTYENKSAQTVQGKKIQIEVEDVISADLSGPVENYWEIIAERQRIALGDALNQNKELSECNEKLQGELNTCKEILDETRTLVEVLQEAIGEDRNDLVMS